MELKNEKSELLQHFKKRLCRNRGDGRKKNAGTKKSKTLSNSIKKTPVYGYAWFRSATANVSVTVRLGLGRFGCREKTNLAFLGFSFFT